MIVIIIVIIIIIVVITIIVVIIVIIISAHLTEEVNRHGFLSLLPPALLHLLHVVQTADVVRAAYSGV